MFLLIQIAREALFGPLYNLFSSIKKKPYFKKFSGKAGRKTAAVKVKIV